jgi:rubrerythrin
VSVRQRPKSTDGRLDRMRAPGPVRRAQRRFAIAAVFCFGAVFTAMFVVGVLNFHVLLPVFMVGWVPVLLCGIVFALVPELRLADKVRAARGAVCWDCGYALGGLGSSGECPECGVPYEVEDLARRWESHFDQSCIYLNGVRTKVCQRCGAGVRGRPEEESCEQCGGRVSDFYEGGGLTLDWRRWRMPDAPIRTLGAPAPIRRAIVTAFIGVSVLLVLGIIALSFANANHASPPRGSRTVAKCVAAGCYIAIPSVLTVLVLYVRRVRRTATAAAGAMCWQCLYDLRALGDRGVCPECSGPFNRRVLARRWRTYIDPSLLLNDKAKLAKCLTCGYDLAGLPTRGVCPECGGEYTEFHNDPLGKPPA